MKAFRKIREVGNKNAFVIAIGDDGDRANFMKSLFSADVYLAFFFDNQIYYNNAGSYSCLSRINDVRSLTFIISLIITIIKYNEIKYEINT